MKKTLRKLGVLAGAALALGMAGSAAAQSTWWNLGSSTSSQSCAQSASGCTGSGGSADGIGATLSAWSTTNNSSGNLIAATITDQNGSGIGIRSSGESTSSPDHAIDSSGKDELVLINFGSSLVSLNEVRIGWAQHDADISLLRWDGGTSGPNLAAMSLTDGNRLTEEGWTMVHSADVFSSYTTGTIANTGASSWWIISAYYGNYGGTTAGTLGQDNDYFKLLKFAGTLYTPPGGGGGGTGTPVPEPTSLALVAAALLGAGYTRRRKRAA